jgi:hypothetical protein
LLAALAVAVPIEGDAEFMAAVQKYRDLDVAGAIAGFEQVDDRDLSLEEHALIAAWLGLSHAQQNDLDAARAQFERAVKLDPEVALPEKASPKITKLFDDVRAEVAPARAPPDTAPADPPRVDDDAPPDAGRAANSGPPVAAYVVAAAGGVALLGALVLALVGVRSFSVASDPKTPQPDAQALVDQANVELAVAGGLALGGAVALGAAAYLFLADSDGGNG